MGNRLENLKAATEALTQAGIRILDESSIYETEPWGQKKQDWFLNVVLLVDVPYSPYELLQKVLGVEQKLGRVRQEKWGARTIDIDILYYHDEQIDQEDLKIPHPEISERKFTLIPLVEMCPLETHPITGQTQIELLATCTDPLDCNLTDYKL